MTETKATAGQSAATGLPLPVDTNTDTSHHAQRQRIGDHLLRFGSATTIELRERCNAMHPAGRIKEMRKIGWSIATVWVRDTDAQGYPHRCARYVLTRGGMTP